MSEQRTSIGRFLKSIPENAPKWASKPVAMVVIYWIFDTSSSRMISVSQDLSHLGLLAMILVFIIYILPVDFVLWKIHLDLRQARSKLEQDVDVELNNALDRELAKTSTLEPSESPPDGGGERVGAALRSQPTAKSADGSALKSMTGHGTESSLQ